MKYDARGYRIYKHFPMTDLQHMLLSAYYSERLPLAEVASAFGVTRQRVSQLLRMWT